MKLTQLFLCSAAIALPFMTQAAAEKNNDRWFEVEVILFSQLGDKAQLKENFPDTSKLPKYQRAEDLLAQYLNPDIRGLKHLLPRCESSQKIQKTAFEKVKFKALFDDVSLAEVIASTAQVSTDAPTEQNLSAITDQSSFNENAQINTPASTTNTAINSGDVVNSLTTENLSTNLQNTNSESMAPLTEFSIEEFEKISQPIFAEEAEFQPLDFQYSLNNKAQLLCRISPDEFADYQVNHPDFDYYGFSVDKVPLRIDAIENIDNDNTHLLSRDSLQLSDIITDLRYSKNFKPLLHMGWRQVARPRKQSVPVKVYAGDNFFADHQKQLRAFHNKHQQQTEHLSSAIFAEKTQSADNELVAASQQSQALQLQRAQQARIAEIIAQLPQVSDNPETLLAKLESEDLTLKYIGKNTTTEIKPTPPLPPLQQWFIDGFFNIHLKHYLFITADFTILDKSLSELATAKLATMPAINANTGESTTDQIQAKPIRFKQNRRVISGEVHYFDHPYMGMIVQIRPYTKPEPEEDVEKTIQ